MASKQTQSRPALPTCLPGLLQHLGAGLGGVHWAAPDGTRPFHFQVLRRKNATSEE